MKRLYVTRSVRVENEGDDPEDIGEFLALDWETKEIVGTYLADSHEKVEVGRSRGASGMAWHDNKIYLCCRGGQVMAINPDTYKLVGLAESAFGGFHGMDSDGNTLWLCAMSADALLAIRDDTLQSIICTTKYGVKKAPEGKTTGINAVGFSPSGEMFIMYSHKFHLFNWTTQVPVLPAECKNAPHDITFIDKDHCLYSQSSTKQVWKLNVRTGEQTCVIDHKSPSQKVHSTAVLPGWVRGIAYDKKSNTVFVMAAPGTIIEYDATTWKERDRFVFTKKRDANPFEIILDPRDWK